MSSKQRMTRLILCLAVLGMVAAVPVFAGSAVVGSVTGSMNATVGGQTVLPNATLFSGDSLQVKDGLAVVSLGSANRMVFGRNTVASFQRDSNEVTVLLGQGSVSVFHDANGMLVRMKIGGLSVLPVSGFKTLGEVATLNGAVVVTAKEGTLRVEGNGPAITVVKGKTVTLVPKTSAPPQAGGAGAGVSMANYWPLITTLLAGGSLVLSAAEISKIDSAVNNSSSADSAAIAAESAAAAAESAASAAAAAGSAAASAAAAAANAAGCALDTLASQAGQASPYTPPPGETCPPSS